MFKTCPQGHVRLGENCYYTNTSLVTWHEAEAHCDDMGGHLLEIKTRGQQQFVAMLAAERFDNANVWIGEKRTSHTTIK